jgi:hypothetical protein
MRSDLSARLKQAHEDIRAKQSALKQLNGDEAKAAEKEIGAAFEAVRNTLSDDDRSEIRKRLVDLSPARGTLSAVTNMASDDWLEYQFLLKMF